MTKKLLRLAAISMIVWFTGVFALAAQEGAAETNKESKPVMDVYVSFASSYFFRGAHVFAPAVKEYDKDKGSYGEDEAFPVVPAVQPGVTFYTPIDGLSFDIWSSFAMTARDHSEVKEDGDTKDGLRTLDEIDYLVNYSFDNRAGSWSVFYLTYSVPNASGGQFTEIGFSYSAPVPLSPTLTVANDENIGATYVSLDVSYEVALTKEFSISPSLLYGFSRTSGGAVGYDKGYVEFGLPFSYSMGDLSLELSTALIQQVDSDAEPGTQAYASLGASYSL